MKIKILTSASKDLIAGYRFYEKQSFGLGSYFLDSLYSDIDSLTLYAPIHPFFLGKYRRLLSKRFPFAIFYQLENETVYVYAVLDCRRNPDWLKKKLK